MTLKLQDTNTHSLYCLWVFWVFVCGFWCVGVFVLGRWFGFVFMLVGWVWGGGGGWLMNVY